MDIKPIDLTVFGEAASFMAIGSVIALLSGGLMWCATNTVWMLALPLFLCAATAAMLGITAYGLGLTAAIVGIRTLRGK